MSKCAIYFKKPQLELCHTAYFRKLDQKKLQTSYTLITAPIDLHCSKRTKKKKNPRRVLKKALQHPITQIIKIEDFTLKNRIQMLAQDPYTSEVLLLLLVYFQNSESSVNVIKQR